MLVVVIFQMVKIVNKVRIIDGPPAPSAPEDIVLLREIRDALKNN
jgi:large conductance mechanosensitive channel